MSNLRPPISVTATSTRATHIQQRLLRIVVRAWKVKGHIRLVPHHPAIVRDLGNVEQLAGAKLEHPSILHRCRRCARHDQPDVCHCAALGTDGRTNVLRLPPPGLVSCSAYREAADVDDLELPLLHDARFVGRLEPPKSHLDLREAHEAPRLLDVIAGERDLGHSQEARAVAADSQRPHS